jgi:hypothetical protein
VPGGPGADAWWTKVSPFLRDRISLRPGLCDTPHSSRRHMDTPTRGTSWWTRQLSGYRERPDRWRAALR